MKDKSKYIGQFAKGKKHGSGKQEYKDGSLYVGNFKDGERSGFGKLK